jgi:hypothetical protein
MNGELPLPAKNFFFLGSDAGGERAAVIYTLLQSAELNGLDPEAYRTDVIDRSHVSSFLARLFKRENE